MQPENYKAIWLCLTVLVAGSLCPLAAADSFQSTLDDVIRRTNQIVSATEVQVVADLDGVQLRVRRQTLSVRVTGDIGAVNRSNRRIIEDFLQRTIGAIARAENEFSVIYRQAVLEIRDDAAGSFTEPVVLRALDRIDRIVQRALARINLLAVNVRDRIRYLNADSAGYLQQLHDRALRADPPNDGYFQQLLERNVANTQPRIRDALIGTKAEINRVVAEAEDDARHEADPAVALNH